MVGGLLHDLGKVIIGVQIPAAAKEAAWVAAREEISYYEAEVRVMGFAHDRVNSWVADQWNLPLRLREGMVYHHKPMSARHYQDMAQVVHLGNFMTRLFEKGFGGDDQVPVLSPQAFKALGLDQQLFEALLDSVSVKFEAIGPV